MSGPDFAGVLDGHRALRYDYATTGTVYRCTCGEWQPYDDEAAPTSHAAHLSAALHAELARWLGDEGTREVVARAMAIEDDYDACFLHRDEAVAAGETDDAHGFDEDCAWWTTRAAAALAEHDEVECDRRGPGGECARDHAPCPDFPGLPTPAKLDAGGAGRLTKAERAWGVPGHRVLSTQLVYSHAVVERILATRLAAVQAELLRVMAARDVHQKHAEADRAERDDLRGRLAAVEALVAGAEAREAASLSRTFDGGSFGAWIAATSLRAALANPSAAQGEGEA